MRSHQPSPSILFRCVLASLYEDVSDGPSLCNPFFLTLKMSRSLHENHWGSTTLTLLNVLGVLNVLNVLNVLHVVNVLHVLHGRIVGLLGLVC